MNVAPPLAGWTAYLVDPDLSVWPLVELAGGRTAGLVVRRLPSLADAYRQLLMSPAQEGRLWVVPWRIMHHTNFGLLKDIGSEPALLFTNEPQLKLDAGLLTVLLTTELEMHGLESWLPAIERVTRDPWLSTGLSLSQALARFVPAGEIWELLSLEDHEILAQLTLVGSPAEMNDIESFRDLTADAIDRRLHMIFHRMGVRDAPSAVTVYRSLLQGAKESPCEGREDRQSTYVAMGPLLQREDVVGYYEAGPTQYEQDGQAGGSQVAQPVAFNEWAASEQVAGRLSYEDAQPLTYEPVHQEHGQEEPQRRATCE